MSGTLYIVATPIGNLNDFSSRAISTLKKVNLIAAEDTRHSAKLLQHFDIHATMISLHKYNERARIDLLLKHLRNGESVALISDAGTPLISDPGYHLVREAREVDIEVITIPGPCALTAALSVSGLPADQFVFEGFLPAKSNARLNRLKSLTSETRTIIFYEAPHRILAMLQSLAEVFGPDHYVVVAKELTKMYETVRGGTAHEILSWLINHPEKQSGEFVVLIEGAKEIDAHDIDSETIRVLEILSDELPLKQAVTLAAKITKKSKNAIYDLALRRHQN